MADPHKAIGQYMKKKPSDELIGIEIHDLLTVAAGIIPPAEGNTAVEMGKEAVVADGDPVGIPAEILENPFGTAKWWFAIDDPLLMVELTPEGFKGLRFFEMTDRTGEYQSAIFETMFEVVQELASEQCRHDPYGNEESFAAGYPMVAVRG